jgi:hypothetical protein
LYPGALSPPSVYPFEDGYINSGHALGTAKTLVDGHPYLFRRASFADTLTGHPTNGSWTSSGIHGINPKLMPGMHVIEMRIKTDSERFTYSWAYEVEG